MSAITAESRELASLLSQNNAVKAETGATMFGTDSQSWPASWWDAVIVYSNIDRLEQKCGTEAMDSEARQ